MHTLEDLLQGRLAGAHEVRLTGLGLTEFPRALFALADHLEVLDLSGNQLTRLPDDLHRLTRLRILFASNNPFTTLPPVLGRCEALELVGFKACQIQEVPAHSLPPRLRWLILTDNQLTQLPATLGQRPRLQKLMLSCNQLRHLPDLRGCTHLELLRLASNQLSDFPEQLLELPALAWLALAGNPLTLAREQQWLQHHLPQAVDASTLQIHECLGSGASGHIYRATRVSDTQAVALKVFKAAATSDGTPASELAAGLAAGPHPHVLTPLSAVRPTPEQPWAMLLPLLPAGWQVLASPPDLNTCTRDVYATSATWPPHIAQQLLHDVQSGLQHLHQQGVLHGDVYAHNTLWNPATGHALLSDLGAAMTLHDLPATTREALQQMEWRAFAHLRAEVMARCTDQAHALRA